MNKENHNNSSVKIDPFLQWHLDSDQFEIPDIPLKRKKLDRLIRYLASEAANPFESYISKAGSLTVLAISPMLLGVIFMILHFMIGL
ncbi:hypothetical protein KHA94_20510 [Bacillus sp. FJAT-49705]|uniref:Uncharacterized protein n=1 Tax=Cytobacillus citreus TaxID=2833586 RepID=A0ABS5P065_9BACI|nr:hypothetical protein [Cytobacillus citreus]MBS4192529.1 hypothetical protein [Cytobacillus citreus]